MRLRFGITPSTCFGALWSPRSVASATMWLRADQGITTVSGAVSAWSKITGVGDFTQTIVAYRPAYSASGGPNGTPYVSFDGTDDELTSGPASSSLITATAGELWAVVYVTAATANDASYFVNHGIVADTGGMWGLHVRTGPTLQAGNFDGTADKAESAVSAGAWLKVRWRHSGGNVGITVNNGSEVTVASGNTASLTNLVAIGTSAGAIHFSGRLAEVFTANAPLSAGDQASMWDYLARRYG